MQQMPAIALIIGSVFWFALRMMWAVIDIRYIILDSQFSPRYLSTVESVCQFFFCVGIYVGILFCCMNWSKIGGPGDKPSGPMQHGPVPVGYPTYPAYQTYPQFSQHPQQYPPHTQHPYQQSQQQPQQQP